MKLMSLCLLSTICLGTVNSAMAENSDKVNIWNWSYNIGEHTVADFEKIPVLRPAMWNTTQMNCRKQDCLPVIPVLMQL